MGFSLKGHNVNTIIHIAMLLLGYFALYSAYRAGLAKLEYNREHKSNSLVAFSSATNTWVSLVLWIGLCIVSLTQVINIATP
jgi:hypothetical protein